MKKALAICTILLTITIIFSGCLGSEPSENGNEKFRLEVLQALKEANATLYVTPATCPHCRSQEAILGTDAKGYITIIDCMTLSCPNIQFVPTWEINGELIIGIKTLDELAVLAGLKENGVESDVGNATSI